MRTLVTWSFQGRVLRAGLVTTTEERIACLKLRYEEYYGEQQEIPPHPDEIDVDWADEHSILFCSKLDDRDEVVGTMRLIRCEDGCLLTLGYNKETAGPAGFPELFSGMSFEMPNTNPFTGEPVLAEETVEGSRYVAHQIPLGDRKILHSVIFLVAACAHAREVGIKQIIGALKDHHFQQLRGIGWKIAELMPRDDGQPHIYHGMKYRVVLFPVAQDPEQDYDDVKMTPSPADRRSVGG